MEVKIDLGSFACKHILFLPAMLGCDTTSWLYGVGKGTILKKFKTNFELQKATEAFDSILSTSSQIVSAGESVLVIMYGGNTNESLNTLRNRKYFWKIGYQSSTCRSQRPSVHFSHWQISQLKSLLLDMPMEKLWMRHVALVLGLDSYRFYPTKTDSPPAPDDLLKVMRCNCSTDCSSARCSCQKRKLKCSLACGQCRGTACINASAFVADDEEPCDEESWVYQ